MPFSHHSHSGEFCGHARDSLEDVVQGAIQRGMQVFALTEHIPRDTEEDLYPAEKDAKITLAYLEDLYAQFYVQARHLEAKYAESVTLLVGMEIEWIRGSSKALVESLLSRYELDLFVGSVHHVHGIPIDYDQCLYDKAMQVSASMSTADVSPTLAEGQLFSDYFDAQFDMLQALRPPIVGHFDLIRLYSSRPNDGMEKTEVWQKIERNLHFISDYGGLLEINSSAVRKGLREPYPQRAIVQFFYDTGGKFVLSDDSHGIAQIGACYTETISFIASCGVSTIAVFEKGGPTLDMRFPGISIRETTRAASWVHSLVLPSAPSTMMIPYPSSVSQTTRLLAARRFDG